MYVQMKHRLKAAAIAWVLAILFSAGILLAGSEWQTFPYGQVIGVGLLCLMLFISRRIKI